MQKSKNGVFVMQGKVVYSEKLCKKGNICNLRSRYMLQFAYVWVDYVNGEGLPVSYSLLQEKDLEFQKQIEGEVNGDFTASDGWFDG